MLPQVSPLPGQSYWATKAILFGLLFYLTAKQLKSHSTTCTEFLSGYTYSCWTHPQAIFSSPYKLTRSTLLKVIPHTGPHPLHLSVQAFCLLRLCFFTCWSSHIFCSPVAPGLCGKRGRSRRAATANSISLMGWGHEQSKYLYSEWQDLSPHHDFRINMSLTEKDKNLTFLRKESKKEEKKEKVPPLHWKSKRCNIKCRDPLL